MTEKTLDEKVAGAYMEWERDKKTLTRLWGKDFYGDPRKRVDDAGPKPHYAGVRLAKNGFVVVYTTCNGFPTMPFGMKPFFTPAKAAYAAKKVGFSFYSPVYNFNGKKQFLLQEAYSFFKYGDIPLYPTLYIAEVILWCFHRVRGLMFPGDYR